MWQRVIFIGGPLDGQRRLLPDQRTVFECAERAPFDDRMLPDGAPLPPETFTATKWTYQLVVFPCDQQRLAAWFGHSAERNVFAPADMRFEEVLGRLIEGYRDRSPPPHTRARRSA